jgi:hypothetical protein
MVGKVVGRTRFLQVVMECGGGQGSD